MATLFDDKLLRHYHYLRDTLPLLVPELNIGNDLPNRHVIDKPTATTSSSVVGTALSSSASSSSSGRLVLNELANKLKSAQQLSSEMKQKLNKLVLKDFKVVFKISIKDFPITLLMCVFLSRELLKLTTKLRL